MLALWPFWAFFGSFWPADRQAPLRGPQVLGVHPLSRKEEDLLLALWRYWVLLGPLADTGTKAIITLSCY